MTTLSATEARKLFLDIVDKADKNLEEFTITKNGRPKAVIMSADEFESWKETIEIMGDTELMKKIKEGEEDIRKGRLYDFE